jgi:hypothetical protein
MGMLVKYGRNIPRMLMAILLLVIRMGAGQSGGKSDFKKERDDMTLRMVQLARAGRNVEARDVLKNYLNNHPTDGTMFYNLVCLDLLCNEKEQALKDFEQALENGYTNFRLIQADPDLSSLRDDPRFEEMWTRFEEEFRVDFQGRALYLDEGYSLEDIALNTSNPETVSPQMEQPVMSVSFHKDALQVSVLVHDPNYSDTNPPWEDGSGILVNLIQPLSPEDYESRYYYSYGFHASDGVAQATLVGKHGKILLQQTPGLRPVITRTGDDITYEVSIPWKYFDPYGPPLDQEMGLNVCYFGAVKGSTRPIFSLMPEKRASFEADPWRRYVPLHFFTSDRSVPLIQARLYDRLCQSDDLGFQMAHWSAVDGNVDFNFTIHPQDNPAKTMLAPISESEPCETELNFFNFYLNMADLPEGSYNLRASLTNPAGTTFVEEYPFDNFGSGWLSSLNKRIHQLNTAEQSILKYHLFKLTAEVENRLPQSIAMEFHDKFAAVTRMIELCEEGSSCLPTQGLFQGGFTTGAMTLRRCTMYLPQDYRDMESPHLVVVLPPGPGAENDLATKLGQALEDEAEAIVLVPQSHGFSSLATDASANHTAMAIEWAKSLFNADKVTLVGLGMGSDAALETSLRHPDLCSQVIFDGDSIFADMAGFSGPKIVETLNSRTNTIPYTVISAKSPEIRVGVVTESMVNSGFNTVIFPIKTENPIFKWFPSWFQANN